MKTVLTENGCYKEELSIHAVEKHGHFVEIKSFLNTAKAPDAQNKHHVMMSLESLKKLRDNLDGYIREFDSGRVENF